MYSTIKLECTKKAGSDQGEWTWMDQGTKANALPECAVRSHFISKSSLISFYIMQVICSQLTPSCDPLLESIGLDRSEFNGDYISIDNINFVSVQNLDANSADVLGSSTFDAKCAFERKAIYFQTSLKIVSFKRFILADKFMWQDVQHPSIKLECLYVESNASAHWVWHEPAAEGETETESKPIGEDLPQCTSICLEEPATIVGLRKHWDGEVLSLLWERVFAN